jgi:hypothetical protein
MPFTFKDLFSSVSSLLPNKQPPVFRSRFPEVQQDFWDDYYAEFPNEKRKHKLIKRHKKAIKAGPRRNEHQNDFFIRLWRSHNDCLEAIGKPTRTSRGSRRPSAQ